jgi:hypothetical protein
VSGAQHEIPLGLPTLAGAICHSCNRLFPEDWLRDRIERADALVMDLAGHNPNVLIEVGMAVAMHKGESGALIDLTESVFSTFSMAELRSGFRADVCPRLMKRFPSSRCASTTGTIHNENQPKTIRGV